MNLVNRQIYLIALYSVFYISFHYFFIFPEDLISKYLISCVHTPISSLAGRVQASFNTKNYLQMYYVFM